MKNGKVTITLERFKELEGIEKNFKAKLNEKAKELEHAAGEAMEIAKKMILADRDKLVTKIGNRDERIVTIGDEVVKLQRENEQLKSELASTKNNLAIQLGMTSQLRTNEKFYMDRYLELERKMWKTGLFRRIFKVW